MPKDRNHDSEHVELGAHIYEVVPQPLPYLKRRLGTALQALGDADAGNMAELLTDRAYEVLEIFLPDIMPRHEWEGFATEEAMAADDFDAATARRVAPTGPQVRTAFAVCLKANGLDVYKHLGRFVDPTLVRALVTKALTDSLTSSSSSSPSPSSASASTTPTEIPSPTEAPTTEMDSSSPRAPASVA